MVSVRDYRATDEDAAALRGCPDGWLVCEAVGWFWVSRADEVTGDEFDPLGPFPTAAAAVDAAVMADQAARTEPGE